MQEDLRELLARTWPTEHVNPALVTVAHIYLLSWDKYTDAERSKLFSRLSHLPTHLGLSTAPVAVQAGAQARRPSKKLKSRRKFIAHDDALAYIERIAQEHPESRRDKIRVALMLMYTCGITPGVLTSLPGNAFVPMGDAMLLVTKSYIYVLTPTMRAMAEQWLAQCATPDRPFGRIHKYITQHAEIAESYDAAQSN
jgi:hypothetical protein